MSNLEQYLAVVTEESCDSCRGHMIVLLS